MKQARFGEYLLPPDWLETSGELRPAEGFPARFGYDAIRVPLYLIWGGYTSGDDIGKFNGFWGRYEAESTPAWVDVVLGNVSQEKQSPGMQAVARLTASLVNGTPLPSRTFDLSRTTDYYSASLLMLTKLAEDARAPR